jgi:hypothetical protein
MADRVRTGAESAVGFKPSPNSREEQAAGGPCPHAVSQGERGAERMRQTGKGF